MLHMAGPVVNVNAAQQPPPRALAAEVALAIIKALDAWAEPLKVRWSSLDIPCIFKHSEFHESRTSETPM